VQLCLVFILTGQMDAALPKCLGVAKPESFPPPIRFAGKAVNQAQRAEKCDTRHHAAQRG